MITRRARSQSRGDGAARNPIRAARGEAPAGVEPASAVLQTAARPSGPGALRPPALPRRAMSSPGIEPGLRPSQGRVRVRHTPRTSIETRPLEPPTRESNPALRLRRPPCVRHTRGETDERPRQESNLVFDLRGVACDSGTPQGLRRSRRPESNRHEPAYKAGASPFGHVGGEQGRKDLNPVREFWRLAALQGARP